MAKNPWGIKKIYIHIHIYIYAYMYIYAYIYVCRCIVSALELRYIYMQLIYATFNTSTDAAAVHE